MNWEAVSALSTAFSAVVILLTVIYAARQVEALNEQSRALGAQLDHLRRATQLEGTLAVLEEVMSEEFLAAYRFVETEFAERMKNEQFRADALDAAPDLQTHKERHFLREMERIGVLVKNGLLDGDVFLDFSSDMIKEDWEILRPLVLEHRRLYGESLWEGFEFLATRAAVKIERRTKSRTASAPQARS